MEKYSNSSSVLSQVIASYLDRSAGNTEEQIQEAKINELIGYYEDVLRNKERISVVFNSITEDGTLICHGKHVRIEMPARSDSKNATLAVRLNQVYEVTITEVNSKDALVKVKRASKVNSELRDNVIKELLNNYKKAENYIKKTYPDEIKEVEDDLFEKYSKHLDPGKDAEEIARNTEDATNKAVGMLIEGCVRSAVEKQKAGNRLTVNDKLFTSLIVPAKVYAIGRSKNDKWAAVDVLGMYITGDIRRKFWADRYVTPEYLESEVGRYKDKIVDVAIIGYSEKNSIFRCSRRAVVVSPWEKIEERVSEGNIIQVRCISKTDRYFYGTMVGISGTDEEDIWDDISIQCYYPTSLNAQRHNVSVKINNCYLCKVRSIDKEHKRVIANTIRESGKWESADV